MDTRTRETPTATTPTGKPPTPEPATPATVTGNPPGDTDTPAENATPDPDRSTVAEPAEGHTGAATGAANGIGGMLTGVAATGDAGTDGSNPPPPSAAATTTGGNPTTSPHTKENTSNERIAVPRIDVDDRPKIDNRPHLTPA